MSYYKQFKQLEYNKNIFRQHCFRFRLQCAALREQNGDCKKLLQIESMFLTLISRINKIDAFKRSLYDNYIRQFNKIVLHMEKLELDLAQLRGQDYVKSLKKTKILAFCNYVNLSIAEADSIPNYQLDQLVEQLLKLKKNMFCIYAMESGWEKLYLKNVKRYKRRAETISDYVEYKMRPKNVE